jgi:hypothetical protein
MIAVLGWGSLIWDPRELILEHPWVNDGPIVRVDFLRRSGRNRVTLVLDESARPLTSLWTKFSGNDWARVLEMLVVREGVENQRQMIQRWVAGGGEVANIADLSTWAADREIDHVFWTGLPPRWDKTDGRVPSVDQVVGFLESLPNERRGAAEEYVRRAPKQIVTPIREVIEQRLGWLPYIG